MRGDESVFSGATTITPRDDAVNYAPIGAVSDPTAPAPQSQTHHPGRPVFSPPSHQCADQRGALSCPLTCSIGSRPLIALNRSHPTEAERGAQDGPSGVPGAHLSGSSYMFVMVLLEKLGIMEKSAKIYHVNSRARNPCHNSGPRGHHDNRTRIDAKASWLAAQALGGVVETFAGFATSLSVIPGGLVDSFHGFAASFWHHPLLPSLFVFPMSIKSPPIHQRGSRRGV